MAQQIVQGVFAQGEQQTFPTFVSNNFTIRPNELCGAGNCLVLLIPQDTTSGATISTISDTINGSWSTTPVRSCVGATCRSDVYLFPSCGAGLPTITVVFSANLPGPRFILLEVSGVATTTPFDGGNSAADQTWGGGATPVQCG